MVNKKRAENSIKLGGKMRKLKLDMNALCVVNSTLDVYDLGEVMSRIERGDFVAIRAVLYASLVDKDITLEELGSMSMSLPDVMVVIAELLAAFFGPSENK